jgi:hypothetical protein
LEAALVQGSIEAAIEAEDGDDDNDEDGKSLTSKQSVVRRSSVMKPLPLHQRCEFNESRKDAGSDAQCKDVEADEEEEKEVLAERKEEQKAKSAARETKNSRYSSWATKIKIIITVMQVIHSSL